MTANPKLTDSQLQSFHDKVHEEADSIIKYFMIGYFIFGWGLSIFHDSYWLALIMSGISLATYYATRQLLGGTLIFRMIVSFLFWNYNIQFILQMHGAYEMNFFYFVSLTVLLFYEDWKVLLPGVIYALITYLSLFYVQMNEIDIGVNLENLPQLSYSTVFLHLAILTLYAILCFLWAKLQKKQTRESGVSFLKMEDQLALMDINIQFANGISQGNLNTEYKAEKTDRLGESLMNMRNSLIEAAERESKEKFVNVGLASIGEILRNNDDNLSELCDKVIEKLVGYMKANQGGMFIIKKDDGDVDYLELMASRAYERKKYQEKRIEIGHGLVGQCAIERKRIYMTDVPEGYLSITSGLGLANPKSLLIVPLKTNEEIVGVIEMASFQDFDQTDIEFLEKVGESIASTVISAQTNQKTKELLGESQEKEEIMKAQEEEMRQNMEEMQATQEDAQRKEEELARVLKEFRQSVIERDITEIEIATHNALENAKKEVNFLDEVPPIAGIFRAMDNNGFDPLDGSSLEIWISRLTTILQKLIENKGIYSYVHVADIKGDLVLVVNDDGNGNTTAQTEGENILDTPIFVNTRKLERDQVYVARPKFNEDGQLLFRMAIPLYHDGKCKGIMQLASYANHIIRAIKNKEDEKNGYRLINIDGEIIYNGTNEEFTASEVDRSICINESQDYALVVQHYSTD